MDDRLNQLHSDIQQLSNLKKQLRDQEKSLDGRLQYLSQPQQFAYGGARDLKATLQGALAPNMMPANVGGLNEVAWPFYFQVPIDFGADASISSTIVQKNSYQIDQEAAFIWMSLGVTFGTDDANASGMFDAPIQVQIFDRQSSRQFNSSPVPVQMLGQNSNPTILPTGMFLQPNAFIDVQVSGLRDIAQTQTGSGKIQFSFFGYRTRIENASKVLSTIYGI